MRPGIPGFVGLWSFAVAQPLYELFARQPTFLLAHDLNGYALLALVVLLSFLLPLVLAFGITLLRPEQNVFGRVIEWLCLFALQLLLSFYLVGLLLDSENLPLTMSAALGIALLFFAGSYFLPRIVELIRFSAVASLLFAGWFLYALPVGVMQTKQTTTAIDAPALLDGQKITDVVVLVFDEWPLSALVNDQLEIREDLFPHIAQLAASSDWYTQASSVAARTRLAVPGLLSGKMADPASSPDSSHHPVNLFSLLEPYYDLNVFEPVTKLCVLDACQGEVLWRRTLEDTAVVYAHLVLPRALRARLPQLTGQWGGFLDDSGEAVHDERLRNFGLFLEQMKVAQSPGLHFFHSLLPHTPYSTLPTGHRLFRHGNTAGHVTSDQRDEIADQPWADVESRYLFRWQLQLVDRMIGQVVEVLRAQGSYERTLFVVTADHGVRIQQGMSRRQPFSGNYIDIASVPMFVKRPGQREPQQIKRRFETIDLLPLVLQTVGLDPAPYELGRKVDEGRRLRSHMEYLELPDVLPTADYQAWWPLEEEAPAIELPEDLGRCASSIQLHHPELYIQTHPEHFLAAHMLVEELEVEQLEMVVQFNGSLYRALKSAPDRWSAFLAAEEFQRGFNSVRILGREDETWCEHYTNAPDSP